MQEIKAPFPITVLESTLQTVTRIHAENPDRQREEHLLLLEDKVFGPLLLLGKSLNAIMMGLYARYWLPSDVRFKADAQTPAKQFTIKNGGIVRSFQDECGTWTTDSISLYRDLLLVNDFTCPEKVKNA